MLPNNAKKVPHNTFVVCIELIRKNFKTVSDKTRQAEHLDLFGRFVTRAYIPQIIQFPSLGRLSAVQSVGLVIEIRFTQERRENRNDE